MNAGLPVHVPFVVFSTCPTVGSGDAVRQPRMGAYGPGGGANVAVYSGTAMRGGTVGMAAAGRRGQQRERREKGEEDAFHETTGAVRLTGGPCVDVVLLELVVVVLVGVVVVVVVDVAALGSTWIAETFGQSAVPP